MSNLWSNDGKRNLKRHIERMHEDAVRQCCPWCGGKTKDLERHLKSNECNVPEEERTKKVKQKCEICG